MQEKRHARLVNDFCNMATEEFKKLRTENKDPGQAAWRALATADLYAKGEAEASACFEAKVDCNHLLGTSLPHLKACGGHLIYL